MTTEVLSGKPLAALIQQRAQQESTLLDDEGLHPVLAVVVATDDESTHWYVRSIERAAGRAGIGCRIVDLGHDATEQVLANVLTDLSAEPTVHGIILQTPLPAAVRPDRLVGHPLRPRGVLPAPGRRAELVRVRSATTGTPR